MKNDKRQVKSKGIFKSTEGGKLYITLADFFNQEEIKKSIEKIKDSAIYKKLRKA